MSMPLVLLLKPWVIWPVAGQPQLMTPASAARAGFSAGVGAGAGVAVDGVEVAAPLSDG